MSRGTAAWEFRCSLDCDAPRRIAWDYWTNIANWNDPPANFRLDGPFGVGSRLTTTLPGQTLQSVITYVVEPSHATIEMELEDATLTFDWQFEVAGENRTRMTQHISLHGTKADSLVPQARILE